MSHTRPEYSRIIANRALIFVTAIVGMLILGMGFSEQAHSGSLEPSAPPAPTMHTLEQSPPSWDQILPATDGEVDGCNSTRFSCVLNNTAVRDNETGLVWQRFLPATPVAVPWDSARNQCLSSGTGGRAGWRLPSIHELLSLVVPGDPAGDVDLPADHPFTFVNSNRYWTATTIVGNPAGAWGVYFGNGSVGLDGKSLIGFVWCVRGGGPLSEY